jgi:DNA-directed RNA polymerase specialized sigma24 family protein
MDSFALTTEAQYRAQFSSLFRDNYKRLSQYVSRRVHRSRVEDVVASSFAIALQNFSKVENPSLPWQIRIASFEVANAERRACRSTIQIRFESVNNIAEVGADDFDGTPVRSALARLSKTDQVVLRLVHRRLEPYRDCRSTRNYLQLVNARYHRALKKFEGEIIPVPKAPTQEGILP